MSVLNCNPITGNIITDTSATIIFNGEEGTISDIYLGARRTADGNIAKNNDFDHLVINGVSMERTWAKDFYDALWVQFFSKNKDILTRIREFDDYTDGMPNNAVNSAARVFRVLKSYGLTGLSTSIKGFTKELRSKRDHVQPEETKEMSRPEEFSYMDTVAKKMVKTYCEKLSKDEIVKMSEKMDVPDVATLKKLVFIRYDEYEGNTSDAYIESELARVKHSYTSAPQNKGIILED